MAQTPVKDIRYLNKDFVSFRNALINFAQVYFPNTYNDFNESSLGMMFMEMVSYVGDVLSFYMDSNVKESILLYAEERKNVVNLAQTLGYKYRTTFPATTNVDIYQLIPGKGLNNQDINFDFALKIDENMVIQSETFQNVQFRTTQPIDFSNVHTDNFQATVYQVDANGTPIYYLLKKTVPAVAGTIQTMTFAFGAPQQFATINIPYTDVIEILNVVDSNGNPWYEVDYLAQDTIFLDEANDSITNNTTSITAQQTQRILKLQKVANRFTSKKLTDRTTQLQFGSGISAFPDEILVATPQTLQYNTNFVPNTVANDFLSTRTYGQIPSNTTLTVQFTRGGGIQSNVPQNDLTQIASVSIKNQASDYSNDADKNTFAQVQVSLAASNAQPAVGGRGEESIDEIQQNAIAFFYSQDRAVTDKDYLIKTLSMPAKYGSVSKAYVKRTEANFSVDIYCLGYDFNKSLINLNDATKQNLANYLYNYRELTTAVNIKNAYVIDIGVQFVIIAYQQFNKNTVLLDCINALKDYFNIDNWEIGEPIVLADIYNTLGAIDGVRSVVDVTIVNKFSTAGDTTYSNNYYHIPAATLDGIIYTSQDPSIFEVRYPNVDILGSVK